MTEGARQVLQDCRHARSQLVDGLMGRDWRLRWITAVILLRSVGYVLKKVDAKRSPKLRGVVDEMWERSNNSKPEPEILWEFIERDRDLILKEYEVRAGQGVVLTPGEPTKFLYTMKSGAFAGHDQRDVIDRAIAWWEAYLDEVDRKAGTP